MPTGAFAKERRPSEDGASVIAATLEEDIVLGLLAPRVRLVEDEPDGKIRSQTPCGARRAGSARKRWSA